MAEGGIAASMGNVNSNDNWQVHFRDTMRGGKFLNYWRMAELHAKEAPDRVWELETYGALFDRTPDGRISQRNFGGHEYPRLAHVGDRTGLELIRTLQQKIVSLQQDDERELGDPEAGSRSSPSAPSPTCSRTATPIAGAFGYWRESGRFVVFDAPAVILATGGIGKSFKVTQQLVGVHRRRPRARPARRRDRSSTWSSSSSTRPAWSGRRRSRASSSPSRSAATAASCKQLRGQALHVRLRPRRLPRRSTPTTEEEGDRWYTDPDNNKRPPELLPRDEVARAINSEVKAGRGTPARRRLPRRRPRGCRAEEIMKRLPSMHHQFKELADVDITKEPMEVGPTCHYVMGGVEVDPDTAAAAGVAGPVRRR